MGGKKVVAACKPLVWEILVTIAALLLISFLVFRMECGEEQIRAGVLIVYALSCFAGGWIAGKSALRKRFLRGLGYGGLYFLLLVLISLTGGGAAKAEAGEIITAFAVCAGAGMLGGMFSGIHG